MAWNQAKPQIHPPTPRFVGSITSTVNSLRSIQAAKVQQQAGIESRERRGAEKIIFFIILHPGRLTWNLQITHLERNMIFQTSMIMFHVNLQGCIHIYTLPVTMKISLPKDCLNHEFPEKPRVGYVRILEGN